MVNEEQILVRIINKVEGSEELIKEKNLISEVTKSNGDLTKVYEDQTAAQRKRVTVTEKSTKEGREQNVVGMETLQQGPKFQMHFLGIMFGGMALNRAMSSLTATSKEWVGIGELMSTTMGVVMLPATLALLDEAVLPLMDALLSMPENVQTIVGVTVLGLENLGKIAEIGGQIALGAAAFSYQFPAMATAIKTGLTSALSRSIGTGIVVSVGLIVAWESIDFIRDGIEEGSLKKELLGVLGLGTGLGLAGLAIGGPVGGLLGFTLGISMGLVIDWFIKEGGVAEGLETIGDFAKSKFGASISAVLGPTARGVAIAGGFIGDRFADQESTINTNSFVSESGQGFSSSNNTSNQSGNISIVNNINVADKREFERMIKVNNDTLVREVRRNATV
jgi:hypothetical protein